MKRLIKTIVIAILVLSCVFSVAGCNDGENDGAKLGLLKKKYTGESFYTVYSYKDEGDNKTSLVITSDATYQIGRIATATFSGDNLLIEVSIPDTVIEIQEGAFKKMKRLESITLPFIGKNANADAYMHQTAPCAGKSVDAARNLGYIFGSEEYDFGADIECNYGANTACALIPASLRKVVVAPSSDYQLPMYAFGNIGIITTVELQNKVTAVGTHAFDGCRALNRVVLTKDVVMIYDEAFNGCESLTNLIYTGTKAEWNAVEKKDDWMKGSKLETVTCSDGIISFVD